MSDYSIKISIPAFLDYVLAAPLLLLRRFWYGHSFRRIKLVNSDKRVFVDQADYTVLSKHTWYVSCRNGCYRAVRFYSEGQRRIAVPMHRQIMQQQLNTKNSKLSAEFVIDHKDRNPLNNCRHNLRLATSSQNAMNRCGRKKDTSSKYKGVSYSKRHDKWLARIQTEDRRIQIGTFYYEEDAAHAYDKAAKKFFGEFAYLNFPQKKIRGLKNIINHIFKKI